MRILLLTQLFQPEAFFKGLPFARALAACGHDVEVLTGFPNYPGGKLYPGYRVRFYQREKMDGIPVHRVPLYPSHDRSALHRILNYLSLSLSVLLLGPWLVKKPDVVYVYNLVTLGPPAFLLRLLYGTKVLIDVQDLWPESVTNSGMLGNSKLLRILGGICNWVYRRADHLTVLSPGFRKELISRGVQHEKIDVIYNWCDEDSISSGAHRSDNLRLPDRFVILYAGAMGLAQGMDTILDCARLCAQSLPDVQFNLIGWGVDRARIIKRAEELQLKNVSFLSPRLITEMGEVFAQANALLVHLKDDPLFRITIPSKTQAYLFIGKPLIMAMRGDAADLVHESDAGICCKPSDPQDMMNAIKTMRNMPDEQRQKMGEAGHRFYMDRLSFSQGVNRFERIMKVMVNKSS